LAVARCGFPSIACELRDSRPSARDRLASVDLTSWVTSMALGKPE
jgi:hypothetical protein